MQLHYPKTCPVWLKTAIDAAVPQAMDFLTDKYGAIFDNVNIVIQPNSRRSRYFDNKDEPHAKFGSEPVATISCRSQLQLYTKNSLGKYKQGVNVGPTVQIACSIIHELTHHYQHVKGLSYGELETTANELEFLRIRHPDWYKLIMIEEKV